jgi:bile acid transporter
MDTEGLPLPTTLTSLEESLLAIIMIVVMFGMGASLTFKDFAIALRKPQGILVGLMCQYGLMPFIAFSLGILLQLHPVYMVGLVLMGCMPGGTTSNMFTYFSKGQLSLSILMTVASTLVAIVMVPITLTLYLSGIEGVGVPTGEIAKLLFVLLVPTVLGMVLRWYNANAGALAELTGSLAGIFVIFFLIATWVPKNVGPLLATNITVYAGAIGIGLVGFGLSYVLAKLLRQDARRSRTISMETGIQNGPLAILLVGFAFTGEQAGIAGFAILVPVLYSIFILVTSTGLTFLYRGATTREELARDAAKIGSVAEAA